MADKNIHKITMAELQDSINPAASKTGLGVEYTVEELAITAKTSVRNIRNYQEKGLLAPPRLQGRKGFYSTQHLTRLNLISDLIDRGYAISSIRELLDALECGIGIQEFLGVESAITSPWTDEQVQVISFAELLEMFGDKLTQESIIKAQQLELFFIEGDQVRVNSMQILEVGKVLTTNGIPLLNLLEILERTRGNVQRVADDFVKLVTYHLLEPYGENNLPPSEDFPKLAEIVWQLRPLAEKAVKAELARAMDNAANNFLVDKMEEIMELFKKQ